MAAPYISYSEYVEMYGKPLITEDEFPQYAGIASDLIDSLTSFRIVQVGGLSALPAWQSHMVVKAAAAQVTYLISNGLDTVTGGQAGEEFTVGKVHVGSGSHGSSSKQVSRGELMISPLAFAMLEQSGLCYRGVPCVQFPPDCWPTALL